MLILIVYNRTVRSFYSVQTTESSLIDMVSVSVSFFNGISTLFRLFNAEAILLEEQ